MGFDWEINFPHDAMFCVPWYYGWFYFTIFPLIGAMIMWLPVYYFDKMIQPKHMIIKQFVQSSQKHKNESKTTNDHHLQDSDIAKIIVVSTQGSNDDNIDQNTKDSIMASENPNAATKMVENYRDAIMTQLSSVLIETNDDAYDSNTSKMQLSKDICKLIVEYTGDEYTIMQFLYSIRRKYYLKYKICNIIFLLYLYFQYFCIIFIFYYLIDEYVKFYKDTFGNEKWNGKIGWNAYVSFGMVWLFNPMLKLSHLSSCIVIDDQYQLTNEYLQKIADYPRFVPIFTSSHKFEWNKKGINLNTKPNIDISAYEKRKDKEKRKQRLQGTSELKGDEGSNRKNYNTDTDTIDDEELKTSQDRQYNQDLSKASCNSLKEATKHTNDENESLEKKDDNNIKEKECLDKQNKDNDNNNDNHKRQGINSCEEASSEDIQEEKCDIIKIDNETNLKIPSDLSNKDVLYYVIDGDTEKIHSFLYRLSFKVQFLGILLSIVPIFLPLIFVGCVAFIPLVIIFACFGWIAMILGQQVEDSWCYPTFVWSLWSCLITCSVSIACLYQGNDWGNCFVYAFKGDYCPNNDTFWHSYYGVGFNELSFNQKLFMIAWHLV